MSALELRVDLQQAIGRTLPAALLYDFATVSELVNCLQLRMADADQPAPRRLAQNVAAWKLSSEQALFHAYARLYPSSSCYNISALVHLPPSLELPALLRAVKRTLERHPALRVRFSLDGTLQTLVSAASLNFDLVTCHPTEALCSLAAASIDIVRGELPIRFSLVRTATGSQALLLNAHHICVDARGLLLACAEVAEDFASPSSAAVQPDWRAPAFADMQAARRSQLVRAELSDAWWRYLAPGGTFQPICLATDFPRRRWTRPQQACACPIALSPAMVLALRARAAELGSSLFTVLLATWLLVVAEASASGAATTLSTGVSFDGRGAASGVDSSLQFSDALGCFSCLLPIAVSVSECEMSFASFVDRVASCCQMAFSLYSSALDVPLVELVQRVSPGGAAP